MSPAIGDPCHIYQDDQGNFIGVAPGTPTVGDASTLDGDHGSNNGAPAIGDPAVISQDDQGVWIGRTPGIKIGSLWYYGGNPCNPAGGGSPELVSSGNFDWCKLVIDPATDEPHIVTLFNAPLQGFSYVMIFRRTAYAGNASPWENVYHVWVHDPYLTIDAVWASGIPDGWYYPGITKGLLILWASQGGHFDTGPSTTFNMIQSLHYNSGYCFDYAATNSLLAPSGHRWTDANWIVRPILLGTWPTFHFVIQSMNPSENLGYTFNYAKVNLNTQMKAVYQNAPGQYFLHWGMSGAVLRNGVPLICHNAGHVDTGNVNADDIGPKFYLWNGTAWASWWDLSEGNSHPPVLPVEARNALGDSNCSFYGTPYNPSPWFMMDDTNLMIMITPLRYIRGMENGVEGILIKREGMTGSGYFYDSTQMKGANYGPMFCGKIKKLDVCLARQLPEHLGIPLIEYMYVTESGEMYFDTVGYGPLNHPGVWYATIGNLSIRGNVTWASLCNTGGLFKYSQVAWIQSTPSLP